MRKKVAVLMLIIPLLIILAVYTATASAGISVAVPVGAIKIITPSENGIVNLDISSDVKPRLEVEVVPALAKNKKYTVNVENLDNTDCGLSIDGEDGKITASDAGKARITVKSNDGGFTDSIVVIADSSSVLDLYPVIYDENGKKAELTEGGEEGAHYSVSLTSEMERYGFTASLKPTSLSHSDIVWTSSDERVLKIDASAGTAFPCLPGKAEVTASVKGKDGDIVKIIDVEVTSPGFPSSGVLVNGKRSAEITLDENADKAKFFLQTTSSTAPTISGAYIDNPAITPIADINGAYEVEIDILQGHGKDLNVAINAGGADYVLKLALRPYSFEIITGYDQDGDGEIIQKAGSKTTYIAFGNFYKEGVRFLWSADEGSSLGLFPSANGSRCVAEAVTAASVNISVRAVDPGGADLARKSSRITAVTPVSALVFDENATEYGIGRMLTLGNVKYETGEFVSDEPVFNLRMKTPDGFVLYDGSGDVEISIKGDSASLSRGDTALNINGDGVVTICARWKYAAYFGEDTEAELTVRTVNGGVNTNSYDTLVAASEAGRKIVLTDNVMLGRKGASADEIKAAIHTMPTTYDWKYYENVGKGRPEIQYIIEFKNDVYGNGYELNAEYIANAHDRTGSPLVFKGPLDFVSMGTAAVKGQDNVSFLVREDGVTLDNVSLKSCLDESLYSNGTLDLSKLRYVGTTLEIAGDTVIKNCRVSNGRTVIRVFGGGVGANGSPIVDNASEVNAEAERVTATIESSILSNAREFILKIGTNRAIRAKNGENGSNIKVAELLNKSGAPYVPGNDYTNDDYFVNNYLLTDVTLKNCVLYNSGVFSVGIDTHFSGEMLWQGSLIMPPGWDYIAATSFASVLRMEGDVKLLDWKRLDKVDSSTLIETTGNLADKDSYLKLNISAMLDKLYASGTEFENIFAEIDGVKYVHGGIAFYGGGKNYSALIMSSENDGQFIGEILNNYRINLSILAAGLDPIKDMMDPLYMQGTLLPQAAGKEDFRFYIYGSNSESSYEKQCAALEDGSAFNWIVPA